MPTLMTLKIRIRYCPWVRKFSHLRHLYIDEIILIYLMFNQICLNLIYTFNGKMEQKT